MFTTISSSIASLLSLTSLTLILASPITPRSSTGPVIAANWMDPCIINVGSTWYSFAGANGNPAGINIQLASSSDLSTWTVHSGYDALPTLGAWAGIPGHVWAPDVVQLLDGSFVMYYSGVDAASPAQHCVGAATSQSITGPYTPLPSTFACPASAGGAIDPDGFHDPATGLQWVSYKIDGNSIGHGGACSNSAPPIVPTPIMLQQVSASDGVTNIGGPIQLITNDAIDGPAVEAPTIAYYGPSKTYYLLYNSGCYVETSYTVRFATAPHVTGPWTKNTLYPFLATGSTSADVQLPGGADASADGTQVVFHGDINLAWFTDPSGSPRERALYAGQLDEYATSAWLGGLYK